MWLSSYGGKLAAYMRFKYPNLVDATLASSAPVLLASGGLSSYAFFEIVTRVRSCRTIVLSSTDVVCTFRDVLKRRISPTFCG